jgi:DNA-binding NarL/FixJ family response regulator
VLAVKVDHDKLVAYFEQHFYQNLSPELRNKCAISAAGHFMGAFAHTQISAPAKLLDSLSQGELEVVTLYGQGYRHKAIATKRGSSVKTVAAQLHRVREKLNLASCMSLRVFAMRTFGQDQ